MSDENLVSFQLTEIKSMDTAGCRIRAGAAKGAVPQSGQRLPTFMGKSDTARFPFKVIL